MLRLKNLFIISMIFLFVSAIGAFANGTATGTGVTNTVVAKYSNSGSTKYTNFATNGEVVKTIFGLNSQVAIVTQNVAPGADVSFAISVTNKGNGSIVLGLTNVYMQTNNVAQGGAWAVDFYTNATKAGGALSTFPLAEDADQSFYLVVTAPAAGIDGASITNRFGSYITNNYATAFSSLGSYTGMDGSTLFGGSDWLTNNVAIAVIQAPNLQIAKASFITNSASYLALAQAGHENDLVPGSAIIYSITWTNAGSGQLLGLSLHDAFDANVTYVVGSIKWTEGSRLAPTTANYASASNQADNSGPNGAFGINNTVGAALDITYDNAIPGNSSGTVMYKVTVK